MLRLQKKERLYEAQMERKPRTERAYRGYREFKAISMTDGPSVAVAEKFEQVLGRKVRTAGRITCCSEKMKQKMRCYVIGGPGRG